MTIFKIADLDETPVEVRGRKVNFTHLFSFDLQHLDYCFSHCKKNECLFL
jgi:hypothetical protein